MTIDDKTRTELEAAVFRRLVSHLQARTDVQNIDLMNLAGFCRNCLSNWMKEEADAKGVAVSKDESREAVYGMPYEEWKAKHQGTATPEQLAAQIREHLPEFAIDYEVDPRRQAIADSWPQTLDDSPAREDWGWQPRYDLSAMVRDMLEQLRSGAPQPPA